MTTEFEYDVIGEKIKKIEGLENGSGQVVFIFESGTTLKMYHVQECCEDVSLEDIDSGADEYEGAEIISFTGRTESVDTKRELWSATWTFYHILTTKGTLVLRWYGVSTGMYSEEVDVEIVRNI